MSQEELTYRACATLDEFGQCVQVQKAIWDFADLDALPVRLFVVAQQIGGHNFGAFKPSGGLVGFLVALPGIRQGQPYLHSQMLGVLPEYQNRQVARRLKLLQRADALTRGIRLVKWTFDPLELKNAFFNLERLGVLARRYVPNLYGVSSSSLHGRLPTDRLVAEWWVDTPRVSRVLGGGPGSCGPALRLHVSAEIGELKRADPEQAREIQQRLRAEFEKAFAEGWIVTGFDRNGAYLLEKGEIASL